jgi:predicted dehydrogenase
MGAPYASGPGVRVNSDRWLRVAQPRGPVCCALKGAPEKITLLARDIERAALEAFAEGVTSGQHVVVTADQAVNGIAVLEAIVESAASRKPVQIA